MSTDQPMQRTGQEIRSSHPYAYRSGEWALIIGTDYECGCYQLKWPNGDTDDWAIIDPVANYQFREPINPLGETS